MTTSLMKTISCWFILRNTSNDLYLAPPMPRFSACISPRKILQDFRTPVVACALWRVDAQCVLWLNPTAPKDSCWQWHDAHGEVNECSMNSLCCQSWVWNFPSRWARDRERAALSKDTTSVKPTVSVGHTTRENTTSCCLVRMCTVPICNGLQWHSKRSDGHNENIDPSFRATLPRTQLSSQSLNASFAEGSNKRNRKCKEDGIPSKSYPKILAFDA